MADDHYKDLGSEGKRVPDGPDAIAEARKLHRLATADPEPERGDGTLTGPAHEEKYGLERADGSAAAWRSRGVHPTENRALVEGEDGAENLAGASLETADAPKSENAAAPRAKRG